ncbi:MAG: hypothetical protein JWM53_5128 [bacterium]|nr:hypothetical protein [bacterium]
MRWTLGLLLLAAAGCGAAQTKMVACPESGCPDSFAKVSPEGTRHTPPRVQPAPMESSLPATPPVEPLPDTTMPPPDVPVPSP